MKTSESAILPEGEKEDPLVETLVQEMNAAWESGKPPQVEDYLARFQDRSVDPQAAVRLIYEEICLCQEHGQKVSPADILRRFPQWKKELEVLFDFHELLQGGAAPPVFPEAGESLAEFHLLAELGRGGLGRVFLASQPDLAHRLVVLKITPCDGQEHLSLARLQHTHIMPLFWTEDLPDRNLRLLCMPLLGVVTLSRLLAGLPPLPWQRSGKDVLDVLDEAGKKLSVPLPPGPERRFLEKASYVEVVVWLGTYLAEALSYAHQRGLVHLDLKPSNVLLGSDGQPLILDFHLARRPVSAGETPELLGGTPEYMAPELHGALAALRQGRPAPADVDERADLYSLGLMLYEALGGKKENGLEPLRLPRWNPAVSVGLADIVGHCLEADPGRRYPQAAALAEDLRRHRQHLPLRGVGNRSWKERWRKWRRRRPLLFPMTLVLLLLGGALMMAGLSTYTHLRERRHDAEAAFFKASEQIQTGRHADAVLTLTHAQDMVNNLPGSADLAEAIARQLRLARFYQEAQKLGDTLSKLRFFSVAESLPTRHWLVFNAGCQKTWQNRSGFVWGPGQAIPLSLEQQIHTDLLDLAILWSEMKVRLASGPEKSAAHQHSLSILAEAEQEFGPCTVLNREQLWHARALGKSRLVEQLQGRPGMPPRTAWDHYALGRLLLRLDDLPAAAGHLQRAVELDPQGFLPHFYRGVCARRRGQYQDALIDFTFCLAQAPMPECYYYRGQAWAALKNDAAAIKDLTAVLAHDPHHEPSLRLQRQLQEKSKATQ